MSDVHVLPYSRPLFSPCTHRQGHVLNRQCDCLAQWGKFTSLWRCLTALNQTIVAFWKFSFTCQCLILFPCTAWIAICVASTVSCLKATSKRSRVASWTPHPSSTTPYSALCWVNTLRPPNTNKWLRVSSPWFSSVSEELLEAKRNCRQADRK